MKRYLPVVLFLDVLIMTAMILGIGSFIRSAWDLWLDHSETTGKLVSFEPHNHERGTYVYQVDGQTYTGSEDGITHPKVGGSVTVYYSPKNPQNSSLSDPTSLFWGNVGNIIFALMFFPASYVLVDKVREWMLRRRLLRL